MKKTELKISVPKIEESMGMSVSRFKTCFRKETGMPSQEYY